jgi:uncharacterized protein with HEPN domain
VTSRDDLTRLTDIVSSIDDARAYLTQLDNEDDTAHVLRMAEDAILYRLLVIGEAARSLNMDTREAAPLVPWTLITGMRNRIAHEYFRLDMAVVRDIVNNSLALVRGECLALLASS